MGVALMMGLVPSQGETSKCLIPLSTSHTPRKGKVRTQWEGCHLQTKKSALARHSPLILDIQAPQLWEINPCRLSHLVHGIFLWQSGLIKTDIPYSTPPHPHACTQQDPSSLYPSVKVSQWNETSIPALGQEFQGLGPSNINELCKRSLAGYL